MPNPNRLVLIGNGFDLAHGLKTSYKDFIDWYMCKAFQQFCTNGHFTDALLTMQRQYAGTYTTYHKAPANFTEVINCIECNDHQFLKYNSHFYQQVLDLFSNGNWVDIEYQYFQKLKAIFRITSLTFDQRKQ